MALAGTADHTAAPHHASGPGRAWGGWTLSARLSPERSGPLGVSGSWRGDVRPGSAACGPGGSGVTFLIWTIALVSASTWDCDSRCPRPRWCPIRVGQPRWAY